MVRSRKDNPRSKDTTRTTKQKRNVAKKAKRRQARRKAAQNP